jgi:hypothetical protein
MGTAFGNLEIGPGRRCRKQTRCLWAKEIRLQTALIGSSLEGFDNMAKIPHSQPDIHRRVSPFQVGPESLDEATGHDDRPVWALLLEAEGGSDALPGLIPGRSDEPAGVEYDNVGLFGLRRDLISCPA